MTKLLEVNKLSKKYSDGASKVLALNKVTFSVAPGDRVAIVGPSGSGKTTLLEIVSGLNRPTDGYVYIEGKNIHKGSDNEISAFRNKTLGFVFQMMHLQDYMSAMENVALPIVASGASFKEAKEKARELLNTVGMKNRTGHYPKMLSGGEMQRVAIARALANNPKIIMADEPTGKLDRKNASLVMALLEKVALSGVTVLVITHDEKIAERFPRIIELRHGKIVQDINSNTLQ